MTPALLSGPAVEPLSLDEAKSWLRIDSTAEDDLVCALISSARLAVEAATRRMLITQSWRFALDEWPHSRKLSIPFAPFRSLDAICVYDVAGTPQPLSPALYQLDPTPENARLAFTWPLPAPGRPFAGIAFDITLGYGAAAGDVPRPLRQAMLLLMARWHENRGDAETDVAHPPPAVAALLAPYRRMRLS